MTELNKNQSVVVLPKEDGTPSNIAVVVGGPDRGSIVHRQDGPPNCRLKMLSFILSGSEDTYRTYEEALGKVIEVK